jgi:hypothetical protein
MLQGRRKPVLAKTMAFPRQRFIIFLSHPAIDDRKVNQPRAYYGANP